MVVRLENRILEGSGFQLVHESVKVPHVSGKLVRHSLILKVTKGSSILLGQSFDIKEAYSKARMTIKTLLEALGEVSNE